MKRAAKSKWVTEGRTATGGEGGKLSRFLKAREGDFEIQGDFWRETIHVTSPKLPKSIAFGATLKTYANTTKIPIVTVWLKPLRETYDKKLRIKMLRSIKTALNNNGYSVKFR